VRPATLFEIGKQRGRLPARVSSVEEVLPLVRVAPTCESLTEYLKTYDTLLPLVRGDADAIERVSYELCEDQKADGVLYFEARYSPHLFSEDGGASPEDVVRAVNRGLERGRRDFGVDNRSLLCCMRPRPEWSNEVVELARRYREHGVVGIDLAGDETNFPAAPHRAAFEEARRLEISRTVHAGEAGPAENVEEALDMLHAQRIGHGYYAAEDPDLFERILRDRVHLECCVTSSLHTQAVPLEEEELMRHPVAVFPLEKVNFGLSTDGPSVSNITLSSEFELAMRRMDFNMSEVLQCTRDSAESAFLPPEERRALLDKIEKLSVAVLGAP
jgi:adenosine deaminase